MAAHPHSRILVHTNFAKITMIDFEHNDSQQQLGNKPKLTSRTLPRQAHPSRYYKFPLIAL